MSPSPIKPCAWLLSRNIEIALFLVGIALRLTMVWNFHVRWTFDADDHWEVVRWIAERATVPPPEATVEAFHPPLFYALVAWFVRHGVSRFQLAWLPIVLGTLRLAIVWAGLELYVRHSRFARIVALALAAVLSANVQVDGMLYPEPLSCLWHAIALLLIPLAFRSSAEARWPLALLIGFVLGLAMLTKISGFAVVATLGLAVILEMSCARRRIGDRLARALPWVSVVVVVLTLNGWYYARNVREYGRPFVTSFDLPSQHRLVEAAQQHELLDRRTLGFVFGWDKSIFTYPYSQSGIGPNPRFFPVLIASTFQDFWGAGFMGWDRPVLRQGNPVSLRPPASYARISRLAVIGGTIIALTTALAWIGAWIHLFRSRDFGRLTLLLVSLATVASALYFSTAHPADGHGVTKGNYLMFGAPPLFALVGVAAAWALRKRQRWPILGILLFALGLVSLYTFDCRFGLYLLT